MATKTYKSFRYKAKTTWSSARRGTLSALAQARGLTPVGYESEAEGLLENVDGKYRITEVTVRPRVVVETDAQLEPGRKTMEAVEARCFVSNSITSRVTVAPEFVVAPAAR